MNLPIYPASVCENDDVATQLCLPNLLRSQAEKQANKTFINICGRSMSFAETETAANRLANGLRKMGVGQSDRVAILLPNCLEFVIVWFGAAKLGAITVPSNPDLKGGLLAHNLNNCGAKVLFAARSSLSEIAAVQESLANIETLVFQDAGSQEAREAGVRIDRVLSFDECLDSRSELPVADVHFSDSMVILYTSGTTGPAKGVVMSYHHCCAWSDAMARNLGYTENDSYFSALPLFHTDAMMFGVYMPLLFGTETTLVDRFSASKFWGQVRTSYATATNLLGAMAVILMRAPETELDAANSIRVSQCIPMIQEKTAFESRFGMKLVTAYGQTETSFVTLDTTNEWRENSCGRAHPDWEVSVVDKFDRAVPVGVIGEIVSRPKKSWIMFSGYDGSAETTVKTLRNLWYHSGDAGCLDEDGWLYFKHRIDEGIRRRGENISAYEVESIANKHPDVVESAAVGVPSEYTEEEIMLVVVRKDGSTLAPPEMLGHFEKNAAKHMVPKYIEISDQLLPRTPTEKISRASLKKRGPSAGTFRRD